MLCADSTKQPRVTPVSATDRGQAALYLRQTSLYPWRAHCLLFPDSFAPALARCERAGVNTPALKGASVTHRVPRQQLLVPLPLGARRPRAP